MAQAAQPQGAGGGFDLDAAQWQRLRELLDEGLALDGEARAAWLQALHDGHGGRLKPRLATLLARADAVDDPAQQRLEAGPRLTSAGETTASAEAGTPLPGPGMWPRAGIGPYRLLRLLGEGGMGAVWLAERTDLLQQRQVALKLPHGAGYRPGLAQRMARERDILAALAHPHIAHLYDAGVTEDGQPWLAIEYVDGVRIDEHCRQEGLPVNTRLQLMLQVCDAVAHAHARLVVHRDLKPANILINREGQVKLLDFGIAKLLESDALDAVDLTQQHGQALTLAYAAPEQMLGQPLSTAADIYALGVVLFELLAGRRPFEAEQKPASRSTWQDTVLNKPAPRLSHCVADASLARQLRGDLDVIVDKALRKQPTDRYPTVVAMADDLRRHLAHEPLLARPESWLSRLRKLARRQRAAFAAGSLAVAALLAGAAVTLWQAREVRLQRDLALQAQAQAQEEAAAARLAERMAAAEADLSSFLLADLSSGAQEREMVRQLERATAMVRAQYREQPALLARMLVTLAANYRWISLHEQAQRLYDEAEPLLRQHGPASGLAQWLCQQAFGKARAGDVAQARELVAQAHRLLEGAGATAALARGECLMEEAAVLRFAGEALASATAAERGLAEFKKAGRGDGEVASEALNLIARARVDAGQFAAAVQAARESVALLERTGRDSTPGLRNAWGLVARSLREGGRPLDALPAHGANGGFDPASAEMPTPVRLDYAETLIELQRFDQALPLLNAIETTARSQGDSNQLRFSELARFQMALAADRLADAERMRPGLERMFQPLREGKRARARYLMLALIEHAVLADQLSRAEELLAELGALTPAAAIDNAVVGQVRARLQAQLSRQRGDGAAAVALAEKAVTWARQTAIDPQASLHVAKALLELANAQQHQGLAEQARQMAAEAQNHARQAGGQTHPLAQQAAALAAAQTR